VSPSSGRLLARVSTQGKVCRHYVPCVLDEPTCLLGGGFAALAGKRGRPRGLTGAHRAERFRSGASGVGTGGGSGRCLHCSFF